MAAVVRMRNDTEVAPIEVPVVMVEVLVVVIVVAVTFMVSIDWEMPVLELVVDEDGNCSYNCQSIWFASVYKPHTQAVLHHCLCGENDVHF